MPAFIIATDLTSRHAQWPAAVAQLEAVRASCERILGFDPNVLLGCMPAHPGDAEPAESLRGVIQEAAAGDDGDVFVIPGTLDFSLWQRDALGEVVAEARRHFPRSSIHHDDVDLGHPLLVAAFAQQVARAIAKSDLPAQRCGLIIAASGHGDPASRAQSYRLMRLVWEELGLARAEVGFVRHAQPFLAHVLEHCALQGMRCVIVPQTQWAVEHAEYARVVLENFQRQHPEAGGCELVEPPGAHPNLTAWFVQRMLTLWRQKRDREGLRVRSAKAQQSGDRASWDIGQGVIARAPQPEALAEVLSALLPREKPERVLVKVTWHGYATGTYTDPAALDLLLGALPAPAIILEGHTSSRNLGGATFDWEREAEQNRAWIRQQDAEYLQRTGLAEVLARHNAQYVNVTESWWDQECACRSEIERILAASAIELHHAELADFVPRVLLPFRGCPMISFAKFKGPTRLGISNMFGLIPAPLRSSWHGPNITWPARVCCDIAKLYGALFELSGVVEGLFSAVRWNRQGLYRSRWGNYDLTVNAGYLTASRGLVAADILASRLQGQDVLRSAFFDVVRERLGWDSAAAQRELPEPVRTIFV